MAFLDSHPGLGFPAVAGLGLLVGSFLNVVILRLPRRLEWEWKRDAREILEEPELYDPPPPGIVVEGSHCPHCKRNLSWYENIPVISWAIQGGKCRGCKAPISIQYPLVELLTALLFVACVWRFGFGWKGFGAMLLTGFLISLSGIDFRTRLLPDQLTLPLLWLGLIASTLGITGVRLPDAVWGAVGGYMSLWLVYWGFKLATGKEGMGFGDFKLFAALGAWFGWQALVPIILMASVIGALVGIGMKLASSLREGGVVPFGPFLAMGGLTAMIFGPQSILRVIGL